MLNSQLILDPASPEAMALHRACGMGGPAFTGMGRINPGGAVGYGLYQRVDDGPAKGVAYVNLSGVLGRTPMLGTLPGMSMGFTHTDDFVAALDAAAADTGVRAIVLRVDSPGGFVDGVTEAVRAVRRAKSAKPVVALASRALSLGYWIACQADELLGVATSRFGSLGIVQLFEDTSAMAAKAGIKVVGVATHEHKLDMTPGMPIGAEALARRQEECEALNLLFIADVAQARRVGDEVVKGWAETACFIGQAAAGVGLIDAVIDADQVEARALALADAREKAATTTAGTRVNSPTAMSAGGNGPAAGAQPPSTGATAMAFDPLKMQKDDPEGYAQARSHFQATFETEKKVEEEKPKATSTAGQPAAAAGVATFAELDAAIGKKVPNRDALIARAQRERMTVPGAMAAAQDEMAGQLSALDQAQKQAAVLGAAGTGTAAVAGAGAGGGGATLDFMGAAAAMAKSESIPLDDAMSRVSAANPALYNAYQATLRTAKV